MQKSGETIIGIINGHVSGEDIARHLEASLPSFMVRVETASDNPRHRMLTILSPMGGPVMQPVIDIIEKATTRNPRDVWSPPDETRLLITGRFLPAMAYTATNLILERWGGQVSTPATPGNFRRQEPRTVEPADEREARLVRDAVKDATAAAIEAMRKNLILPSASREELETHLRDGLMSAMANLFPRNELLKGNPEPEAEDSPAPRM